MSLQYRSTFADSLTILWSIDLNRQQYFAIAALVCMACTSFASDDQDKKKPQAEKSEAAPLVLTNSSGAVPDFSVLEKELGILPSDEAESSDPQDKDPKAVPVEKIARRNSGNDVKTEVVLGSNKGEQKSAESSAEADASVG